MDGCSEALAWLFTFHSMLSGRSFAAGDSRCYLEQEAPVPIWGSCGHFYLVIIQLVNFPLPPFCWTTAKDLRFLTSGPITELKAPKFSKQGPNFCFSWRSPKKPAGPSLQTDQGTRVSYFLLIPKVKVILFSETHTFNPFIQREEGKNLKTSADFLFPVDEGGKWIQLYPLLLALVPPQYPSTHSHHPLASPSRVRSCSFLKLASNFALF